MKSIKANRVRIGIAMLVLPMMLWAQGHGVQVGLRGGSGLWSNSDVTGSPAPEMGLDVHYLLRWRVRPYTHLGLYTGLDAAYSAYKVSGAISNQYSRTDYYNNTIEYTAAASVVEQHKNINLSLPVLFALQTHGFTLNIGPKLLWVAYNSYQSTVDNATIDAYYPAYGVHVTNQSSTGQINTPYTVSGRGSLRNLHLLACAELGYEWQLGDPYDRLRERYVGVQAYVNYGMWSLPQSEEALVSVSPIMKPSTSPQITISSIQSTGSPLSYMSFGVRCYYTLQTVDYPSRGWHREKHTK